MADYGARTGASLRDALNQAYPLTNLGGIATGFPPGGVPPRVGVTAPRVPPQAGGPVIPQIPPVPAPTGAAPSIPGAPPNPQDPSAQATLLGAQGAPPNYAAGLGFQQWRNNPGLDQMVVPPFGLPPDRNTIDPNALMPLLQQYRRTGQENI